MRYVHILQTTISETCKVCKFGLSHVGSRSLSGLADVYEGLKRLAPTFLENTALQLNLKFTSYHAHQSLSKFTLQGCEACYCLA
jgi:hypothetical protein